VLTHSTTLTNRHFLCITVILMAKKKAQKKTDSTIERPPVIAIMGHIDHGKSTLLDYIRKTNIVDSEAGGITQHVSAYEVEHTTKEGVTKKITFLDTPGHEAFGAIRVRGVDVADIAILVVAADDSVKPQTLEALEAIQKKNIPFIVAINKIDKPQANIDKVKLDLTEKGVYVEGYGGSIPFVAVSAISGDGVGELLDTMLLVAEFEELKANPSHNATGTVIETAVDAKKGLSATLVIKDGTLSQGEFVVTESGYAPVRIMQDFSDTPIREATVSSPIKIIGWSTLPQVGALFQTVASKKEAETITSNYHDTLTASRTAEEADDRLVIPIILEADTAGSLEAIIHEIKKIPEERVRIKIVQSGIGNVTEKDIKLASGNENTIVIGFNTNVDSPAKNLAERSGVTLEQFDIIYKLSEWLEQIVVERTPSIEVEEVGGELKVLKIFSKTRNKQVIGGKVTSGQIILGRQVKIMRRENEIGRGTIKELQQQKLRKSEVQEGNECGLLVEASTEIVPGDYLQNFSIVTK